MFATYNYEPMQDFGPKMGGGGRRMLRSGHLLDTLRYFHLEMVGGGHLP